MNYQETCDYLFSHTANFELQGSAGYKPGLETSLALDEHYGHPHEHFRSIHVAGTNGKGSVSHLMAAQLQGCGYRVGLYTSPHIITPILSVITNISLDHTQLLGDSVEQIAIEKGGIIKRRVPVVIGEATPETRPVFEALAQEADAPIIFAEDEQEIVSAQLTPEGYMHYTAKHLGEFECELTGDYQPRNMNTVVVALHKVVDMGYMCDCIEPENNRLIQKEMNRAFKNVVKGTGLQGRWQTVRRNPTVVCDTGHNPGAWEYLSKQLEAVECRQLHIVFGMVEDKDVYTVMSMLPKKATYFFTKGSTKRAFPENSLKVFGDQFGLKGDCYPTVEEAYKAALEGTTNDDFIFIGGSFYVVADFMKLRM